jgi:methylenetetrahydrofolate dehydrogenase (NADP+)/methenyltetrahydrofolate cyclohydrolase
MIADGKHIAQVIEERLLGEFANAPLKKVCFVLFGNDPASIQFIKIKTNIAERLGIKVELVTGPQDMIIDQALGLIDHVVSKDYDGIVVQLPLPKQLDIETILNEIPAEKDIDALGFSQKTAPVAQAVFEILNFYTIDLKNKNILVIGNGRLVGKPVARMLTNKGFDYDVIDKDTDQVMSAEKIKLADIIISGVGVPHMIKPEMIKEGVILIDAGTSEEEGRLVGDIDPTCAGKALIMTPVPGGVGPVTVVILFANLL